MKISNYYNIATFSEQCASANRVGKQRRAVIGIRLAPLARHEAVSRPD